MNIEAVPDNSQKDLSLNGELDQLTFEQRKKALILCRRKLRIGGKLCYTGYDLSELTRGYDTGYVELGKFNEIIAGLKSVSTLEEEVAEIEKLDLKVKIKRFNNYMYYLEAVRETL